MLVDTHCHLNMMVKEKFGIPLSTAELDSIGTIVKDAKEHQVEIIITVGTNLVESQNSIEIAKRYPDVYATVGIHPTDATEDWRNELAKTTQLLEEKEKNKIVAIGECGLDFYWPGYNVQQQKDLFKAQIELALEHDLALTIHTRDASDETLRSLEEFKGQIKRGVLHCFGLDQAYANQLIELGLVLGIGGIITYPKNEQLQEIVKTIDLKNVVLETDAPWLPPQSARGKQNHPKYISEIAHFIANLRGISFDQVAQQTTENAKRVFALD